MLLKSGQSLPAEVVILGVGVAPATSYVDKSLLGRDGSLTVDEHFQIKGVPDAYAIGDIATFPYLGPGGHGSGIRIEHCTIPPVTLY